MNYAHEQRGNRELTQEFLGFDSVMEQVRVGFDVIPLIEKLELRESASALYERLRDGTPSFLLESADPAEHQGRFSFIGRDPLAVVRLEKEGMMVNGVRHEFTNPYTFVEELLGEHNVAPVKDIPTFYGGAVGLFGYDLARYVEPSIGPANKDTLELPEMALIVPGTTIALDHYNQSLSIIRNLIVPPNAAPEDIKELYDTETELIAQTRTEIVDGTMHMDTHTIIKEPLTYTPNMSDVEFKGSVKSGVKSTIVGDIVQVVPSRRMTSDQEVDHNFAYQVYQRLKPKNPSRHAFLFEFGDFEATGCSPETLVRVSEGELECMAIAGTRPRGRTAEEDAVLAQELRADTKEQAEHIMLVDLCRNDVGRVCEPGSVEVSMYAHVENYSHVMHMTSKVTGTLKEDTSALQALASVAPAGTLSGAPKISAMQEIDKLEPDKRGFYGGAVGYVTYGGELDSCIFIRSIVVGTDGKVHVQAGAGVVADSDPDYELQETILKARAPMQAIEEVCRPQLHVQEIVAGNQNGHTKQRLKDIGKRVLFIDNYDSFTYNVVDYIERIGARVDVVRNDKVSEAELIELNPDFLVVSPGPHTPERAGISMAALQYFAEKGTPSLGICLGHEALAMVMGGELALHTPMHGKTSAVDHDGRTIFRGIKSPMQVMRYHSLIVQDPPPAALEVSATTVEPDGSVVIMGLRHRTLPVESVQFHPESMATPSGLHLIENFLKPE